MPIENYIIDSNPLTDPFGTLQRQIQANNQWSAEQAQRQMDFQREMSDTAHQREVADLKAAGLNPVLSARLGGASTPSGAMGQTDTSGTSSLVDLLNTAMETANSAALAAARNAGGSLSSGSIPSDGTLPVFKNPKNFEQMIYNILTDTTLGKFVYDTLHDKDMGLSEIGDLFIYGPDWLKQQAADLGLVQIREPGQGYGSSGNTAIDKFKASEFLNFLKKFLR